MLHLLDHDAKGMVTPSPQFENHDSIFITTSLTTVNNNAIGYQISNFPELPYTMICDTHLADFMIFTTEQIKHLQPVNPALLSFMIQHGDTSEIYINELLKVPPLNSEHESYWFPTPEEPGDPATYTAIQYRIHNELRKLRELKKLNSQDNEKQENHFFRISTGPIQHSAQKNRNNKLKKFSLTFTTFLPDTGYTLASIVNSR